MAENTIQWDKDADGIVTLTLDDPTGSANVMNEHYTESMGKAVEKLVSLVAEDPSSITGVVITSAKKTFFAGGDLKSMINLGPDDAQQAFDTVETVKKQLRTLETFGRPVVAAINGAALGGGLEIALATHHRIAADAKGSVLGLPEVTLGLLPGGGGVTRTVRMLGIQNAFMTVLSQGTRFKPAKAKEIGLVDEVLPTVEELVPAAKAWIKANPDAHEQPWDKKGYKMPGGTPSSPGLAGILPSFPALLKKQTKATRSSTRDSRWDRQWGCFQRLDRTALEGLRPVGRGCRPGASRARGHRRTGGVRQQPGARCAGEHLHIQRGRHGPWRKRWRDHLVP
jgi:3-hydroxyacyl-CoA dehydrogenase/enoyl-CoA hydratase/3-hydroxybutyryl-CoA epimerase